MWYSRETRDTILTEMLFMTTMERKIYRPNLLTIRTTVYRWSHVNTFLTKQELWILLCVLKDNIKRILTAVESLDAKVISRLPFKPIRAGIRINISLIFINTFQCWKGEKKAFIVILIVTWTFIQALNYCTTYISQQLWIVCYFLVFSVFFSAKYLSNN